MEITNIKNRKDFQLYCRNFTRMLESDFSEPEFLFLREVAHLKVELSKIDDLPEKDGQILYMIHEFLLSDAIIGKVARFKIWSYTKLFAL